MVSNIEVIKVPLGKPRIDKEPSFESFKELYLGLLENKLKIKPNLPPIPEYKIPSNSKVLKKKHHSSSDDGAQKKDFSLKKSKSDDDISVMKSEQDSAIISNASKEIKKEPSDDGFDLEGFGENDLEFNTNLSGGDDNLLKELDDFSASGDEKKSDVESIFSKSEKSEHSHHKHKSHVESESDSEESSDEDDGPPPQEETLEEKKEELLFRFKLLRKKYGNLVEDEDLKVDEFMEYDAMKAKFKAVMKRIHLDDSVENYRMYLTFGFIGLEYVCTNFINIDMGGFAEYQLKKMQMYDKLLIELGEKTYSPEGSNLPVEVRLAGLILLQGLIFWLGKMVSKRGDGMSNLFNTMTGFNSSDTKSKPTIKRRANKISDEELDKMME